MLDSYPAAARVEDPILCEIYEYCKQQHEIVSVDGQNTPKPNFTFRFPFSSSPKRKIKIPVIVILYKRRAIYIAFVKEVKDFSAPEFEEFLVTLFSNDDTSFTATGTKVEIEGKEKYFALARWTDERVTEDSPKMSFVHATCNLKYFLKKLPQSFFPEETTTSLYPHLVKAAKSLDNIEAQTEKR